MYYIGIDIGGTNARAGLIRDNEIVYKTKIPSEINGSEKTLFDRIFTLIDDVQNYAATVCRLPSTDCHGIGIGVAGMVLAAKGILLAASNLKLEKTDVVACVQKKYNVPVKIKNDLSMFALAEARLGACHCAREAREHREHLAKQSHGNIDNLVYIAIGTGLNIGVINNGKLFEGADGASLEYGQTSLWDATVETYLSGPGYKKFGQQKMLEALDAVILNLANTYRPQKIVLGGGVSDSITPEILEQRKKHLKENNYGYKNAPEITLEISSLAHDGAILGAAALFQQY